jgi:hypothetical protein
VSRRALRWLLWGAALVALPVPLLGIGSARVPPLQHFELGGLALAFTLFERAQGVGPSLAGLFLAQGIVWALVLWLAAALLARALTRLPPLLRTRVALFAVVLGLALAIALPIYHTPYSSRSAHSTLLGVYW